jgi:hypothetical protein
MIGWRDVVLCHGDGVVMSMWRSLLFGSWNAAKLLSSSSSSSPLLGGDARRNTNRSVSPSTVSVFVRTSVDGVRFSVSSKTSFYHPSRVVHTHLFVYCM